MYIYLTHAHTNVLEQCLKDGQETMFIILKNQNDYLVF